LSTGKRTLPPFEIVQPTLLTSSFVSNPVSVQRLDRVGLEIIVTGTPTGTVTVQGSIDYVPPTVQISPSVSPATWFDIPLDLDALTGGPQTYVIDMVTTAIPWLRISYTFTSGTGSMTAVIVAKES